MGPGVDLVLRQLPFDELDFSDSRLMSSPSSVAARAVISPSAGELIVLEVDVCASRSAGCFLGDNNFLEVLVCASSGWGTFEFFGMRHRASDPVGDRWDASCMFFVLFLVLALAVKAMAVGIDFGLQQWREKKKFGHSSSVFSNGERKKNSVVATDEKKAMKKKLLSRVRVA
jgi:hypothetical protein